jgi:4-hydroxybenzoate polyprenyltransferase
MNAMVALVKMMRPAYAMPMTLAYTLTVVYACDAQMHGLWADAIVSSVALLAVVAAAYVYNDVCDAAIDAINAADRPIPSGKVSVRVATTTAIALTAAGLLAACATTRAFAVTLAGVAAGLVIYNRYGKRRPMLKPIFSAALTVSIYPLAVALCGEVAQTRLATLIVFAAWYFCTAVAFMVISDLHDLLGDAQAARGASPFGANPALWRKRANGLLLAATSLLIVIRFVGCGDAYAVAVVPAFVMAAIATRVSPMRARMWIHLECSIVGLAALADVIAKRAF